MKRIIFPIVSALVLAAGFLGADGLYQYAEAQGEAAKVAELDAGAGPTVDIGSADTVEIHLDGAGPVVAPPVALPDPVEQPAEAGNAVYRLYKDGALVPAVILAAFFILVALRNKIPYLRTGRRAAVVAALLGGVTMLAERGSTGMTPNLSMLVSALLAGLMLYVNGSKASEPAKVGG